jgi:branched-chain amino acid transport system substrate-binding protein
MAQMKKMPVNDFFAKNGSIRDDGRMVHDMYLLQVKKPPSPSPGTTTRARHDPRGRGLPAAGCESRCPLVKK